MAAIVGRGRARAWGMTGLVVGAWLAVTAASAPGQLVDRKFTEKNWEAGRVTYVHNCAICHGLDGHGQTPSGKKLGIVDLYKTVPKMAESRALTVLRTGSIGMKKFAFPEETEGQLLDYLATVPAIGDGQKVYLAQCAECHGPDGKAATEKGKFVKAADLTVVVPQRTADQLAAVVAGQHAGHAGAIALNEKERAQVLRYLCTLPPVPPAEPPK